MAGALQFRAPSQGGRVSNPGRGLSRGPSRPSSEVPTDAPESQELLIITIEGIASYMSARCWSEIFTHNSSGRWQGWGEYDLGMKTLKLDTYVEF